MKFGKSIFLAAIAGMFALTAQADTAKIKEQLSQSIPGLQVESVAKSEIEGLYRVESSNSDTIFTNADASFFINGSMFAVQEGRVVNLSEQRKGAKRAKQLAAIAPEDRIVFPAEGETKARIAVFTDIDCGYCRKLHKEVPELNRLGVEVSYLAYPRAGIGSPSYDKIVSAWCSEDKLQALTEAKQGISIPSKTCANPVAAQFELGGQMGVRGTPAIVLEDGTMVPGYMPAQQLAKGLGIL